MSMHVIEIESVYFSCLHVACILQTFLETRRCVRGFNYQVFQQFRTHRNPGCAETNHGLLLVSEIYD